MATNTPSTRQLLVKIPSDSCLSRHSVNGTYYGVKKFSGKRKEHSLEISERKIPERKLKEWIKNLDPVDAGASKTRLSELPDKFVANSQCVKTLHWRIEPFLG